MKEVYIHYGHKRFDKDKFVPIKNHHWVKPFGGFWASSINAKYGWKDWNKDSEFRECKKQNSFKFTLKDNAKILKINCLEDLKGLPRDKELYGMYNFESDVYLDFEQLVKDGYDAIEVNISNDDRLYWALYGWDCDSLLVLNKEIIEEVV